MSYTKHVAECAIGQRESEGAEDELTEDELNAREHDAEDRFCNFKVMGL